MQQLWQLVLQHMRCSASCWRPRQNCSRVLLPLALMAVQPELQQLVLAAAVLLQQVLEQQQQQQ